MVITKMQRPVDDELDSAFNLDSQGNKKSALINTDDILTRSPDIPKEDDEYVNKRYNEILQSYNNEV